MQLNTKKMKLQETELSLPPIPDKLYFTIGEVAQLCQVKPHVLRYWEQEFSELNPSKRRGNRRYYLRNHVLLIRRIKDLLYSQGYTIEGARQQINSLFSTRGENASWVDETKKAPSPLSVDLLKQLIADLESIAKEIQIN